MTIKEILDKINSTLGADAPAEIKSWIADAKQQVDSLTEANAATNRENANRRQEARELTQKIEDLTRELAKNESPEQKAELAKLQKKADQYDSLIAKEDAATISRWKEIQADLSKISETDKRRPRVEEINKKFKAPDGDTEIDPAAARYNLDIYDSFKIAGGLDEPSTITNYGKSTGGELQPLTGKQAILKMIKTE